MPHEDVVGVLGEVSGGPSVLPAGELVVLLHGLVGEIGHVVKIERPLGSDALSNCMTSRTISSSGVG